MSAHVCEVAMSINFKIELHKFFQEEQFSKVGAQSKFGNSFQIYQQGLKSIFKKKFPADHFQHTHILR